MKDETAYAVIKFLNGYLFIVDIGGYHEGYSEGTLMTLANKAKFYGVNEVVIESNFGDGMFSQLLKPVLNRIHPCAVQEINNRQQKEKRIIDTLEPLLMSHKIVLNKSVIMDDYRVYERQPAYSFIYQMTRLCDERGALAHDDRLDAVAMAVAYWHDVLDRDANVGMEEHLEEELEMWADPDGGALSWGKPEAFNDKLSLGKMHVKSLDPFR